MKRLIPGSLLLACILLAGAARADVQLPKVFSDSMVLQRNQPVAIWGEAAPGEQVTVKFRDQSKTAVADQDGKWSLKLDPLKVGEPSALTVSGANEIALKDVLVGEVWIGSGQSNMAGIVNGYVKGDEVLAKLAEGTYPQLRMYRGGAWRSAEPAVNLSFSAIMFAFGQSLQADLDVPVGLIVGAVGGTPSGRWLTPEMLASDKPAQKALERAAASDDYEKRVAQHQVQLKAWKEQVAAAEKAGTRAPRQPRDPVKTGECTSGQIGDLYNAHIQHVQCYTIAGVLWDQGESGTAIQGLDQFYTMGALIGGWRQVWGQGDFPFLYIQKPSGGGCAWDMSDPVTRMAGDFTAEPQAAPPTYAGVSRELHIRIMQHPNTAMVQARDLGSGIHPLNKSGYGQRAARVARGFVYEEPVEIYGPLYKSHTVDGGQMKITFTHTGKGLAQKHGDKLQGFQIAGEDKVFHWGDARIEGNQVIVSSDAVESPQAVRYAWAQNAPWANLFNQDGLPAIAFRTDSW
ncbi:sialate O-acetylesterase [Lignipirellula cremea]|uniref:Sialate O-acetylesterase domain-containing protein n=1 Tax=Lignipirellula cremea TaxID=2528010 RepID=A0A518DSS6_9BACT|nr:sialate O-acetylesterase [Lignipirellula cremea]QDU94858.1 hypothetical protein Pla8534_26660 [Lignipirellula cremea]